MSERLTGTLLAIPEELVGVQRRELDDRRNDGLYVRLTYFEGTMYAQVDVKDAKTGDDFSLLVSPDEDVSAYDVFNHPFANQHLMLASPEKRAA